MIKLEVRIFDLIVIVVKKRLLPFVLLIKPPLP